MKQVVKNELVSALTALGKLVCRTSPVLAYRTIRIQSTDSALRLSTVSVDEELSVELAAVGDDDRFDSVVNFAELKDVLKGSNAGCVIFDQCDGELMMQLDSGRKTTACTLTQVKVEWPETSKVPEKVASVPLPEGFVKMLTAAAPLIDCSNYRRILQGINLSRDGITATNGKELLNIPCEIAADSFTIPFPLALMATKEQQGGTLAVWRDNNGDTYFRMILGTWCWSGKALNGLYPNWKQIIPNSESAVKVRFSAETLNAFSTYLKQAAGGQFQLKLSSNSVAVEALDVQGQPLELPAEIVNGNGTQSIALARAILEHLLQTGHNEIRLFDSYAPVIACGGIGTFVAMPLRVPAAQAVAAAKEENNNLNQKENEKMNNETTTNNITTPIPAVAENTTPLEELGTAIEEFKLKLKSIFDESNVLSRKVKEVALSQKQKERDFIQAKRAIERIRMAI